MMATRQEIEAAKTLSEFCKTAPGILPERVTTAMAIIDAATCDQQTQAVNERLLKAAKDLVEENTVGDDECWRESDATTECREEDRQRGQRRAMDTIRRRGRSDV